MKSFMLKNKVQYITYEVLGLIGFFPSKKNIRMLLERSILYFDDINPTYVSSG